MRDCPGFLGFLGSRLFPQDQAACYHLARHLEARKGRNIAGRPLHSQARPGAASKRPYTTSRWLDEWGMRCDWPRTL